jgi:hypothetical protein
MRSQETVGFLDGGLQALLVGLETWTVIVRRLGLLALLRKKRGKSGLLDTRESLGFMGGLLPLPNRSTPSPAAPNHDEHADRNDLALVGSNVRTEMGPKADELVRLLQLLTIDGASHRMRR